MGVDEAVWASVRRAHEDTTEPAAQFCRRLGVSASTYYLRRRREEWASRPGTKSVTSRQQVVGSSSLSSPIDKCALTHANDELAERASVSDAAPKRRVSAKRLTTRLYAAIDQELQQLEAGAGAGAGAATNVADIERRTRTLMNMIRGLEKVLELDTDKKNPKGGRTKRSAGQSSDRQQPDVTVDDAERMRQDIAERLKQLHAQWADPSGSGSA